MDPLKIFEKCEGTHALGTPGMQKCIRDSISPTEVTVTVTESAAINTFNTRLANLEART